MRSAVIGTVSMCVLLGTAAAEPLKNDIAPRTDFHDKGYRSFLEAAGGASFWGWRYGSDMFSLDHIQGYQWCPYLFTGMGVGARYNTENEYHDFPPLIFPLFANIRVNFSQKIVAPFFSSSVGHSFSWRDGLAPSGWMAAANFGARLALRKTHAIHWSFGYELQRFRITESDPSIDWQATAVLNKHFVKFNLGFRF